jgi:hypothetical protein
MSPPFDLTDQSTAGQGNTLVGDLAVPEPAIFGAVGFWHKSSEGLTYKDPAYARRRPLIRASYPRYSGPYHWVSPGKALDRQLGNFEDAVGDLAPGEGIQLDCEQAGLDVAFIETAWNYWASSYGGDRVCVYTGRYFTGGTSRVPVIDELPAHIAWWLAWYGPSSFPLITARLPRTPFLWQWGGGNEGVRIPLLGNRRVDSNQIIDQAALDRFCGVGAPAPGPAPAPLPLPPPTYAWALVPEEDDMPVRIGPLLIQATGADGSPPGTVYLADGRGIFLRRLHGTGPETGQVADELADARYQLHMAGYPADAIDGPPTPVDRVSAFGHVVNP